MIPPRGAIAREEDRAPDSSRLLSERVVIVTGAGAGLGAAYAAGLADEGATVVAVDRDLPSVTRTVEQVSSRGGMATASELDVRDWDGVESFVDATVRTHGRIDALVNNAGVFAMATAGQERQDQVDAMLDVNVRGTIACANAVIPVMQAQGGGVIVNVTSGEQMGRAETAVYGSTKAAIATLTYAWAAELAPDGIRVNAISPNAQTHMAQVLEAFRGAPSGQNAGIAPEANVPLLVYLVSELSAEVSGQVLRSFGDQLMVTTRPAIADPVLEDSAWTPQSIAEAVDQRLRPSFGRSGVHRVALNYLD